MLENSAFLDITLKEPEPVEETATWKPVKEPEKPKEFPAICPKCLGVDDLKITEYKGITVRKGFWYKDYTFIPHYCRKCDNCYVEVHTEMAKPKFCWSMLWFFLFGIISLACGIGFAYYLYLWLTSAASGIPVLVGFIGFFANAFVGEQFNNGWQDMTKVNTITGYINPDIEALASLQAESDDWKKWFAKQEMFNYNKEPKAVSDTTRAVQKTLYANGEVCITASTREPIPTPDIPTITSRRWM